jgi:hypothetical protein
MSDVGVVVREACGTLRSEQAAFWPFVRFDSPIVVVRVVDRRMHDTTLPFPALYGWAGSGLPRSVPCRAGALSGAELVFWAGINAT